MDTELKIDGVTFVTYFRDSTHYPTEVNIDWTQISHCYICGDSDESRDLNREDAIKLIKFLNESYVITDTELNENKQGEL